MPGANRHAAAPHAAARGTYHRTALRRPQAHIRQSPSLDHDVGTVISNRPRRQLNTIADDVI